MVSIKGHWRNQDISSSFFEHYFSHFVFHPLFVGKSKSENASREFAEILTVVVCGNEQFWKNGKGLWWPAGFLLFDLLKNKVSLLEGMQIEGFKIIKAKLCSGLEKIRLRSENIPEGVHFNVMLDNICRLNLTQ